MVKFVIKSGNNLYQICLIKKLPQEILLAGVLSVFSGATEIRTREPVVPVTRFPGVPLQPLEHRSNVW